MAWLKRGHNLLFMALFVVWLLVLSASGRAADNPEQPKTAATARGRETTTETPHTLLQLIVAGAPVNIAFLGILGLFSLVGLAIILERLWNLTERKFMPPGLVKELQVLASRKEDNP